MTAGQDKQSPITPTRALPVAAGAWAGLLVTALWAPMLLIIPDFPDLDSSVEVAQYWREHGELTTWVISSITVGYLPLLVFLAHVATRATQRERPPVLSWTALMAGVMFMTELNVALGLAAAAGRLIHAGHDVGTAYGLHVGAFMLAAPATGAGVMFFAAVVVLSHRGQLTPRWLRWPGLVGLAGNVGAIGGLFGLTGPGNSGNGILGGILLPLGTFLAWAVLASVAWLLTPEQEQPG